jgi:hypothetical protein
MTIENVFGRSFASRHASRLPSPMCAFLPANG